MALPELEFFFLAIAVDDFQRLSLFNFPNLGEVVNRRPPRFSPDELLETIHEMLCRGDLIARRVRKRCRSRPFLPTRTELEAALADALEIEYGLTPQGGERWERMSEFDWRYHLGFSGDAQIECTNRETIDVYLAWTKSCVPGSETQTTVRPWQATYWKALPEAVRVQYRERPQDIPCFDDLWLDEFHRGRHPEMRVYVPMKSARARPVPGVGWRRRLDAVRRRATSALPRLLNDADPGVQYAAALRLALAPDPETIARLIEWFRERRSCFALRAISMIDHPDVLDALCEAFGSEPWEEYQRSAYRRDLQLAVASFGGAAVPKLARFLSSDRYEMQVGALRALGAVNHADAGTAILNWMASLRPDGSREMQWRIRESLLALASLGDPRVMPTLAALLAFEPGVAIPALGRMDRPEAREVLDAFVRSSARRRDRRLAAAMLAQADVGFEGDHQRLRLESEKERLMCEVNQLIEGHWTKTPADPDGALLAILRDPDSNRRAAATILLFRRDGEFPGEAVADLLHDPVPRVRANAAYALGMRGSAEEAARILPLTRDESGIVRYAALRVLSLRRRAD